MRRRPRAISSCPQAGSGSEIALGRFLIRIEGPPLRPLAAFGWSFGLGLMGLFGGHSLIA